MPAWGCGVRTGGAMGNPGSEESPISRKGRIVRAAILLALIAAAVIGILLVMRPRTDRPDRAGEPPLTQAAPPATPVPVQTKEEPKEVSSPAPDPAQGLAPPILAGRVLDRETRRPIPGARVRVLALGRCETTTDSDGRFAFSLAYGGPEISVICASASGYAAQNVVFANDPTQPRTEFEILLVHGVDVEGRVTQKTGESVGAAAVYLAPDGSPPDFEAIETHADADGRFRFTAAVAEGRAYWIAAAAPGRVPNTVFFVAPPGEELVIEIETGVNVSGTVRDGEGHPIPGVSISWEGITNEKPFEAVRTAIGFLPKTTTGDDGAFGLIAPVGLELYVRAEKEGWDSDLRVIEVKEGAEPIELVLEPRTSIERTALLLDPAGVPLRDERLLLGGFHEERRGEHAAWVLTDAGGRLPVSPFFAEGFSILWSARGILDAIRIRDEDPREIILRLEPGEDATIDVVDATGNPVAGLPFGLSPRPWGPMEVGLWGETDLSGRATFDHLYPHLLMYFVATRSIVLEPDRVMIRRGTPNVFRVTMENGRGIPVRGRVQDDAGSPLSGGWLWIHDGLQRSSSSRRDREGAFAFDLDPGWAGRCETEPLHVFVQAPPYLSFHPLPCPIPVDGIRDLIIVAERAGRLMGRVRNADGSPFLGEVGFLLWRSQAPRPEPQVPLEMRRWHRTDAWGRFSLSEVPVGLPICLAAASSAGRDLPRVLSERMRLQGGEERDVGILTIGELRPWIGSDLTICVKDTTGRPLEGVQIDIRVDPTDPGIDWEQSSRSAKTDEAGIAAFQEIPPHEEGWAKILLNEGVTVQRKFGSESRIDIVVPAREEAANGSVRVHGRLLSKTESGLVFLVREDESGLSWLGLGVQKEPDLGIGGLPRGTYRLEVSVSGGQGSGWFLLTATREVAVAAGQETLVDVPRLGADGAAIAIEILLPQGFEDGLDVELSNIDGWRFSYDLRRQDMADSRDRPLSLRLPLREGTYDLRVRRKMRRRSEFTVVFERKGLVVKAGTAVDIGTIGPTP